MTIKCLECHTENTADSQFCKKCAAPLPPSAGISVTKTIETPVKKLIQGTTFADRYRIIEELGRGGMGIVYKAGDTKLKRTVALKFLPSELTHIPEFKERFMREAQAAAALDHPNICTVHELDEAEEKTFISMAYIEGQSLKKKIESGPLELDEAVRIAFQVAEGLREAHKKGVVHRDIKSANIMVDERDQAKIMDFGLARVAGGTLVTKEGMTMGTIAYMSPEQARGEEVDHRTDIWSFGVVMYEMFSGQLPFRGEHDQAVVYSILNEHPKPITDLNSDIPLTIEQVVGKALEKDRDKRYQQIDELMEDLRSIAKGIVPEEIRVRLRKAKLIRKKRAILYTGIAGTLIIITVLALTLFTGHAEAIDSIAILPLENRSGDPEQEYFVEGMHEALITELSKIRALKVIARPSVMRYKDSDKPLPEIAKELNVRGIVAGSALQDGEKVRITVQLIEAESERNLWAEKYDKDYQDILALQGEVALDIAQEIKIALTPEEQERLASRRAVNAEAHKAYLRGQYYCNKWTREGLTRSIEYFQQAIEIDPSYALSYAGLSQAYNLLTFFSETEPNKAFPKAKAAAKKALEIDESLAEAHLTLAWEQAVHEWDWEGAERAFKRALELNPGLGEGHRIYAWFLTWFGRSDEAIAEARRAQDLDPLSLNIGRTMGIVLYCARLYDQAIEEQKKVLDMAPDFILVRKDLAGAYVQKRMYDKAIQEFQKTVALSSVSLASSAKYRGSLSHAYAVSGNRSEALNILEELKEESKQRYVPPLIIAEMYTGLGMKEQAFEWLEKAYDVRDGNMILLKVWPVWDPLRDDPRFHDLLRRMNFPE